MGAWLLPDDPRWGKILCEIEHDFYHLPCYSETVANNDGGMPCAFYDARSRGALLIPLVRKTAPFADAGSDSYDATSPYGYASPLCHDDIPRDELHEAVRNFITEGARAGLVTTFLRLHPLLSHTVSTVLAERDDVALITHGVTVSIDLTQSEEALDHQLKTNHKRNIRKLRAAGFSVRLDVWHDFARFQRLYAATMRRVGAVDYYQFSETYFNNLRDCLGRHLHLCSVTNHAGHVVSAGLFTKLGRIVQYHLGATANGYDSLAPSKLMFQYMRDWAKSQGAEIFHLGGGLGGKLDSLYEFKKGFATHLHPFQTARIIHDEARYEDFARRWRQAAGDGAGGRDDYFPIYRRSVAPEESVR